MDTTIDTKAFKRNEKHLARLGDAALALVEGAEIIAERGPTAGYRVKKVHVNKLAAALDALGNS